MKRNYGVSRLIILFVCIALFILCMRIAAASVPVVHAFFIGPWNGPWFSGNTLDAVSLLLTAALGAAAAFHSGCFNLGGEGQIYLGGLTSALVLLNLPHAAGMSLWAAALIALITGGGMGCISGVLKKTIGAHEVITSFLLSGALTPVADYLLAGPLRDPAGNLLATKAVPLLFHILPPSNLSVSCIISLLLVIAGHFVVNNTIFGYRLTIAGSAPAFAHYAGIGTSRYWIPSMTLSGALSGLAGFFAVAGTYGRCHVGFSGGLGWNALAVALIVRNRPLLLIPAALVYAALEQGARSAMLTTGLQFETSSYIQAAVLLFATIRISRREKQA
ncbi:MAG: ABC transporter permease [Treponema sp.]|jgi:simple sugar transport system permease protein|nr:ABC transporter permease [Treponema sp.]